MLKIMAYVCQIGLTRFDLARYITRLIKGEMRGVWLSP